MKYDHYFLQGTLPRLIRQCGCFVISFCFASLSLANPLDGNVVSGNASISSQANSLIINQTSQKAIINWRSFNINKNEKTHFQQPSNGVALNRIDPTQGASAIYGQLTATGKIILINQAGIYFAPSARVDVGGIIASTSDITNEDFLANRYYFNQPSLYHGSIVNEGEIIAKDNGLVALIGGAIDNRGLIQANMGQVVLASGNKFTVEFNGDGLVNFAITEGSTQAGNDINGQPLKSAVSNSGRIIANGGTVLISANNASKILDNSINMKGVIEVQSVSEKNGTIILSAAGDQGAIKVSGKIDASGYRPNAKGGKVHISARSIDIMPSSKIDASGDQGGGEILIGGDQEGKMIQSDLPNALSTTISSNATLC